MNAHSRAPSGPLDIMWFLPTGGDGHYLGSAEGTRVVDNRYLRQIAQATDQLGYTACCCRPGGAARTRW